MTDDSDGWTRWLHQGLKRTGRTQRGLALALGVDASAVSRLLHGQRRLRAHEIPIAAQYLGLDPAGPLAVATAAGKPGAAADPAAALALLGIVAGSAPDIDDDLFMLNDATPIDHVRRPDGLFARPRAFALQVIGASMAPRYEPGDIITVDPDQPAQIGEDMIVVLAGAPADALDSGASDRPGPDGPGRCLLLKRLVRLSARQVQLAQFNPWRDDMLLPRARVSALWPVLPLRAVLGL